MDPDANLEEQREIARRMLDEDAESPDGFANDAARLAELVVALDEWLSKGGHPPKAWSREEQFRARQDAIRARG